MWRKLWRWRGETGGTSMTKRRKRAYLQVQSGGAEGDNNEFVNLCQVICFAILNIFPPVRQTTGKQGQTEEQTTPRTGTESL